MGQKDNNDTVNAVLLQPREKSDCGQFHWGNPTEVVSAQCLFWKIVIFFLSNLSEVSELWEAFLDKFLSEGGSNLSELEFLFNLRPILCKF